MDILIEFFQSLGLIGYIVLGFIILFLINLKKIITLRSPLDSWQHRTFQQTGGAMKPDHLEKKYIVKDVKSSGGKTTKEK